MKFITNSSNYYHVSLHNGHHILRIALGCLVGKEDPNSTSIHDQLTFYQSLIEAKFYRNPYARTMILKRKCWKKNIRLREVLCFLLVRKGPKELTETSMEYPYHPSSTTWTIWLLIAICQRQVFSTVLFLPIGNQL